MARRNPKLSYRDALVQEHLEWMENGGAEQHLKDFSEAPIARWTELRCQEQAKRRRLNGRKWRAKVHN